MSDVRIQIREVILFYECRGWDWLDLVDFLIWRYRNKRTGDE